MCGGGGVLYIFGEGAVLIIKCISKEISRPEASELSFSAEEDFLGIFYFQIPNTLPHGLFSSPV